MISTMSTLAPNGEGWKLIDKIRWMIALRWVGLASMIIAALLPVPIGYTSFSILPLLPLLAALAYNAAFANHANSLTLAGGLSGQQEDTLHRLARLHLALDSVMLVAFVYLTGGLESPFAFFLIFTPLGASVLFDRRTVIQHVNWTWLLFAVTILLVYSGFLPPISYVQEGYYLSHIHQNLLAVLGGMLASLLSLNLVAFLAASVFYRLDRATFLVAEQARRQMAEAEVLDEISQAINASLDLQTTLDTILNNLEKVTDYSGAEINLWDEEQQALLTRSSAGNVDYTAASGGVYRLDEGYSGWIARHRQPLLVSDTQTRDDVQPKVTEQSESIKSFCGVPLTTRGQFIGTLEVVGDEASELTERHLQLLTTIAAQAAVAIENAHLHENLGRQLQHLANVLESVSDAAQHLLASADGLSATSESMSAAGEEVAATVQEIAHGAQVQAEQTEATSRSIEQMSTTIHHIADGSRATAQAAAEATEAVQAGDQAVKEAHQKMTRIEETIGKAAEVIVGLDKRSRQIGDIVDTIDHFADQTNLLSLNAAIEAARAGGEHGRSFGVVADEVRRLAESSASSAQQVAKLVEEVQREITAAVQLMEAGTTEVWQGVQAMKRTDQSLDRIQEAVNEAANLAHDISATTGQQEEVTEGIVHSANEVAIVAEQNAAATEEVSAAVEEQTAAMEEVASSAQTLVSLASQLMALAGQTEQARDAGEV